MHVHTMTCVTLQHCLQCSSSAHATCSPQVNSSGVVLAAQGFYYANGVALSKDDSYVVMAETDRLRVHKIWLKGPKVSCQALIRMARSSALSHAAILSSHRLQDIISGAWSQVTC